MSARAWYLGCTSDDLGDRAIIVGDRGRVALAAERLQNPAWLNEDRGLTTVTGGYKDRIITISAFGMGAPIAAVVLHELASLGVRAILRLGTVMCLEPAKLGDLVLSEGAISREGTSATYGPADQTALPDRHLQETILKCAMREDRQLVRGLIASYDGFYTQMFALEDEREASIAAERARIRSLGAVGLDMETSAVLAVGASLGVQVASLCAATVDGNTRERLNNEPRQQAERDLINVGLEALAALSIHDIEGAAS